MFTSTAATTFHREQNMARLTLLANIQLISPAVRANSASSADSRRNEHICNYIIATTVSLQSRRFLLSVAQTSFVRQLIEFLRRAPSLHQYTDRDGQRGVRLTFNSDEQKRIENIHRKSWFNTLSGTLKPQNNGLLYSSTVISTLAVDGWAVAFGTAMRELGGAEDFLASVTY